jgi:DNA-directed RNA polymerase subunit RPC12/RpoP
MGNFKFNCPNCGQKILGDTSYIGHEIPCPTCRNTLTVPKPSAATAAPVAQSLAATIPLPAMQETRLEPRKLCPLAVASLICCPIPVVGVICGHLAASRIRHDPSLKGATLSTVGLVISYFVLAAFVVYFVIKHTD